MGAISKIKLSGSTGGHGILVTGTATGSSTLIHTPDGTDTDEVWIWADSNHSVEIVLSVEFGGTTDPAHVIHQTIYPDNGLQLVVPGLATFADTTAVRAFAATASQIALFGYVLQEDKS